MEYCGSGRKIPQCISSLDLAAFNGNGSDDLNPSLLRFCISWSSFDPSAELLAPALVLYSCLASSGVATALLATGLTRQLPVVQPAAQQTRTFTVILSGSI